MEALLKPSTSPEAGIFTWDILADRLYADGAVAELFGLNPADAEIGLPQSDYVARVHPDDLKHVAASNQHAIASGEPYQAHYRVKRANGAWAEIMAFGRCFYSPDGQPSHFSGIVYPVPANKSNDASVLWYLLAAYETAKRREEHGQARLILDLLIEIGGPNGQSPKILLS